jgi:Gpi18-like mannosyltransferase
MTSGDRQKSRIDRRIGWATFGLLALLSTGLHFYFLTRPGFEDDLRWQIHWGKRVSQEGLWKLYEGDYATRTGKFNHHDIVDYPPLVPLILGEIVRLAKTTHQAANIQFLIKFLVTVFEILLLVTLWWLIITQSSAPPWRRIFMAGVVLLSPGLALATSGWGQIDSLFCLFVVLGLYLGWKDRFWPSTLLILAAVLTKPQGVIALGCYFLMLLWRRRYRAFWIQGACGFVLFFSLIIAFRAFSHSDFLLIYLGAVGAFPASSWTAFNLWELIFGDESLHVPDSEKLAGLSYHCLGLAIYLFSVLCALLAFWKSKRSFENLMLFAGWTYLAFFLFPTEMHGRFLYYGAVLLAVPAARKKTLTGAYLVLSVILYLNVRFSMDRFAPGMYAEFVMPESTSNLHRVLSLFAFAASAVFFAEILRWLVPPRLVEIPQADPPAFDKFLDGGRT